MFKQIWLAALLLIAFSAIAPAATIEFLLAESNVANPALSVTVSITDLADLGIAGNGVQISANVNSVVPGAEGDLIGLYFNYDGAVPVTGGLTTNVSSFDDANGSLIAPIVAYSDVSGGSAGPFSLNDNGAMHFFIGDNGIGGFDISMIVFATESTPALEASKFISGVARLTSVTRVNEDGSLGERNDSLWLINQNFPNPPNEENPIPEPSTWLMLSAGIGLLALARRRRSA